jgi:hypothetical protein
MYMPGKRRVHTALVTTLLTLAGCFLGTSVVWAGNNEGRISLSAGVDFATDYYFRGIIQETEDFIAQPFADATISLYEGGQGINSLSTTLGIWNSFHGGPTGGSGPTTDPQIWYEADLYGSVALGFLEVFELAAIYTAYTSPNGSFATTHELAWKLSFDDSDLLGAFALSPYVLVAVEVDGGADAGPHKGVYLEFGIEPGVTLIESETYPIDVSFPLTVGLSASDYYEFPAGQDETFGYFDGGIVVNIPLAFIPADFGTWNFSAAGHFLVLGDSLERANNGDSFKAIGIFGLSLAY